MMCSSNNAKFQMNEGDSVNLSVVGDSEHAHGSFSSATSGSVEMSGSMSASATYSGANLSSQRVSMSATFSGGGSMNENFGGGFVNSIVDAGGGGGDSSYSSSNSNMSISQSDENSSQNQTVVSVSSSNESSSYSVDIVQFGEIVGMGSATVTSSSGSGSTSTISSSGNSKSGDSSDWHSRNAVIASSENFSFSGYTNDLSGSGGNPLEDANWHLNWSMSSGSSIDGTVTKGAHQRFHSEPTATQGETQGFTRFQSTQSLSMSDSFSAGQLGLIAMPVVFTESFSIDGSTTHQAMTTTTPPEDTGGGGEPGSGEPGGGTQGPIGGGALVRTNFAQINKTANSLSFHSSTVDGATSRSVAMADSGSRTTAVETVHEHQSDMVANHVGWGKATDYSGAGGFERLKISTISTETDARVFTDFVHDSLEYLFGELQMNDWAVSKTDSVANQMTIKSSPCNPGKRHNGQWQFVSISYSRCRAASRCCHG